MVLFTSTEPEVKVPTDLTVWEWLFESKEYSPLHAQTSKSLRAFVDAESKERLDWADVKSKSTALSACWIREYGLEPGHTVSVFSGNSIWYPLCMLAVIRAGARMNGASAALTVDEIAYALTVAKSKLVVAVPSSLENVWRAASQIGMPVSNVFLMHGHDDRVATIQELIQRETSLPAPAPYQLPAGSTTKELCGYLNFSSGTTGLPKPVMISHYNVIAQCLLQRQVQTDAGVMTKLAVTPLYHIIGTWRFCLFPILLNVDVVMLPAFSMPAMLNAIVEYRIEELVLVPPIVLRLARDPIVDKYDLRHVQRFTSGAAPISSEVLKSLEERFPWTGFRSAYGATEAPVIAACPESHYAYKYATSVGKLLPNTSAKVVDPAGVELGPGEMGEILVRGPQVTLGYLDNEKATQESFDVDGFYHTGDVGYFDDEGLLFVKDRLKEMIKVKGVQVAPAELEDLLLGHDGVGDCAVVGIQDEYAGELPKAYVVLKSGIVASQAEGQGLLDFVKEKKAKYKWLAEIEFVDRIPKSAAGKILRQRLRGAENNGMANGNQSRLRVRDNRGLKMQS